MMYDTRLNNMSYKELVREAELTENILALLINEMTYAEIMRDIERAEEAKYDSDFPPMDGDEIFGVVRHLTNPENKFYLSEKENCYYFPEFNESFNIYHNDICIVKMGGKSYKVMIGYGPYGETGYESTINGLAEAKAHAIEMATKFACNGLLRF